MFKINDKLLSWASQIDENALAQAITSSQMPFIYPHIALMPDAHWGMGATVGSVIPTLEAIMPAAVGVDIGCGMMAMKTQYTVGGLDGLVLKNLREAIERAVPVSMGGYNSDLDEHAQIRIDELEGATGVNGAYAVAANWHFQLGSLGGGNHFIEISQDENGDVWAFLHSGSRGVGNKIAMKHINVAKKLNDRYHISLPDPNLAYLVQDTEEFWSYMREMQWAQKFALLNREVMMARVLDCLDDFMGLSTMSLLESINCHHNYTEMEIHFGRSVWLSRKGAIDASEGKLGLIPGSMGAASYIVEGKGSKVALNSSPHGAGRQFGRKAAKREFTFEDLEDKMKGIEWRHSDAFLDEHPSAYKDIDMVMRDSEDLVTPIHTLHQLVNVKGD